MLPQVEGGSVDRNCLNGLQYREVENALVEVSTPTPSDPHPVCPRPEENLRLRQYGDQRTQNVHLTFTVVLIILYG
jgi:hypothetical protein